MRLIIAWVRSLAAYVFLCLWVALAGPPSLLVSYLSGRVHHLFVLGRFGAKTARQLLGLRLDVEGLEHVHGESAAVYCINHRSNVDVLVFEVLLPRCPGLRALHKAELGRLPILGRVMRVAGFVPVERQHRERAIEAVDAAVAALQSGHSIVLAPEGTRSRSEEMLPFKKGGFVMAIKAQVPVVPIALAGTEVAMPRGRWYATPTTVRVRIGAPIPTAGMSFDDRDRLAAATHAQIRTMLAGRDPAQRLPKLSSSGS